MLLCVSLFFCLALTACVYKGMVQFPEDVKLTRDALALLGYIASLEQLGRTFLTTHRLYRQVVAALQRHVNDGVVAVSAGVVVSRADRVPIVPACPTVARGNAARKPYVGRR